MLIPLTAYKSLRFPLSAQARYSALRLDRARGFVPSEYESLFPDVPDGGSWNPDGNPSAEMPGAPGTPATLLEVGSGGEAVLLSPWFDMADSAANKRIALYMEIGEGPVCYNDPETVWARMDIEAERGAESAFRAWEITHNSTGASNRIELFWTNFLNTVTSATVTEVRGNNVAGTYFQGVGTLPNPTVNCVFGVRGIWRTMTLCAFFTANGQPQRIRARLRFFRGATLGRIMLGWGLG